MAWKTIEGNTNLADHRRPECGACHCCCGNDVNDAEMGARFSLRDDAAGSRGDHSFKIKIKIDDDACLCPQRL